MKAEEFWGASQSESANSSVSFYILYGFVFLMAISPLFWPTLWRKLKPMGRIKKLSGLVLLAFVASLIFAQWLVFHPSGITVEYAPIFPPPAKSCRLVWSALFLNWGAIAVIYGLLLVILWPHKKQNGGTKFLSN